MSIATASRVLNGSTHPVSEKTRLRVLDAAAQLGYKPSLLAQALVKGRAPIVGLIIADIADPYFSQIARGVESVARRLGYLTIVSTAQRSARAELEHVQAMSPYHVTGLVFAASGRVDDSDTHMLQAAIKDLQNSGTRVVKLAHRQLDVPTVLFDNQAAAYDITDYVVSLGHQRIALVDGPADSYTSIERRQGFEQAMRAAGLEPYMRLDGGFEYESGLESAHHIVSAGTLPDAVIAVNDNVAIGVLMGLRQAGVDVPGMVSVAGIDDTPPSRYVALTTVSTPLYELGIAGAQAVLSDLARARDGQTLLPHRLTPRSTTARHPSVRR
uniref:LacI family DNA-binding transcriptional regulator n=1 Tax=Nonomuraea bangladeshensis TaxID=404385 RepID=UPI003F4965F3